MFQYVQEALKMTVISSPARAKSTEEILKKKNYSHLDTKKGPKQIESCIQNPSWVSHHGFLPFIHVVMKTKLRTGKHQKYSFKKRNIYYASHTDSYIYQWYAHLLSEKYEKYLIEKDFQNCPIAYRSINHKSNIDFAMEAFQFIQKQKNSYVLVSDFSKFFDTLDHRLLKNNIKTILDVSELPTDHYAVFKSMTKFCYFNLDDIATIKGVSLKSLQKAKSAPDQLLQLSEMRKLKNKYLKKNPNIQNKIGSIPFFVGLKTGISKKVYCFD